MKHRSYIQIVSILMLSVMAVVVNMIQGNNGNVIVVLASIIILYNIYNIAYVTFKIPNIIGTMICSGIYLVLMVNVNRINGTAHTIIVCAGVINFWFAVMYLSNSIDKLFTKKK